ncbi:MAG: RNA polymerase sigma factor (sigma-70 family) [Saprospiraceae bacterium]
MIDHEKLLSQVANGNNDAFETLYSELSPMLYSTILSHTHNVQAAEEITQDAFVKIYKSAGTFKGGSKVSTWAYSIATRTMIDYQRKAQRDGLVFPEDLERTSNQADSNNPINVIEEEERKIYIYKAIDTLSANQKTAFILAFIDGISQKEIASIMDMTVKGVESLLQRAKSKLRQKLK